MLSPLCFEQVSFAYRRRTPILERFDLRVRPGEITALAAPNGVGKTTVLWLAAGLLTPQQGQVRVFGRDPYRERGVLERVGFLAEGAPLPAGWTGKEVLAFQRDSFSGWDPQEADRLVAAFGLDLRKRVKAMSRGERGKLGLAAVVAARPELLLLDEPILGLDAAARRQVLTQMLGCPCPGHQINWM